jgi:hypothetical protein
MSRTFTPASHTAIRAAYFGDAGGAGADESSIKYYILHETLYKIDTAARTATKLVVKSVVVNKNEPHYDVVLELLKDIPAVSKETAMSLVAGARQPEPPAGELNSVLPNKTWNDGKYTYTVDANGTIHIGSKTYVKGDAKYAAIAANLNKDYSDGKLHTGSAPKHTYTTQSAPVIADVTITPPPVYKPEVSVMDAWWFWPSIGLGTLALGGAAYLVFFRQAPPPTAA